MAVVLDSAGEPFSDAASLLNYSFDGFEERTLVAAGRSFGTVSIQGRDVGVVALDQLEALVPVGATISRDVQVTPELTFPPAEGEQVADLVVSADGSRIGRVPLVVSSVPPPAPPPTGTWWGRAAGATVNALSGLVHALFG